MGPLETDHREDVNDRVREPDDHGDVREVDQRLDFGRGSGPPRTGEDAAGAAAALMAATAWDPWKKHPELLLMGRLAFVIW